MNLSQQRVELTVLDSNKRATLLKSGFIKEGTERKAKYKKGAGGYQVKDAKNGMMLIYVEVLRLISF